VYINEAHPSDGWQLSANVKDDVVFSTPASYAEKTDVARTCVKKLGLELPALIDDFENTTEVAYSAWPDRLYVIDTGGRIAYKAKPGPFGFDPEELRAALAQLLEPAPL
jgi:hypothetical protein